MKKIERILKMCKTENYLVAIKELKMLIQYLETKKEEIKKKE